MQKSILSVVSQFESEKSFEFKNCGDLSHVLLCPSNLCRRGQWVLMIVIFVICLAMIRAYIREKEKQERKRAYHRFLRIFDRSFSLDLLR